MTSATDVLLWGVLPYVSFVLLVAGTVWRARRDRASWSARPTGLAEARLLRWGSPLFHYGMLAVVLGHVAGLAVPASWTAAAGVTDHAYHLAATWLGTVAAAATIVGLVILLYRRATVPRVRTATTRGDVVMLVLLVTSVVVGTWATVQLQLVDGGYDYRTTVSPWFRGLWLLQPDPSLMHGVPFVLGLHVVAALVLFALWPFTRLVHAFVAPVPYVARPYVVYRSRGGAA
ncbi:respiratory nitrate reductase gamma subunit [Sediminihabitans luteus]|uniref:Nitrate reductase-like protein NarX n=1 Tax=Sediminihabitans luteus TaxID=1138585 RepID=A0A2M9CEZ2_9CELL|nr:respiratory nitrate reductase subunit gamma [Sediminihabitans luteus]PJJ70463.1 respiratory nitrate reductase gamma subunit [Sediminihabitans luteus]GII97936.1 nitrate reductase subunit gamma [Sediminihabitans luteus]